MKKAKKVVALALCAVMLVVGSVAGTMAYLTSKDAVTNTFTIGSVGITLNETKVTEYGVADETATAPVKANTYKLIPGHTYKKDPVVHFAADSEASWLFVRVENGLANIEVADGNIASQIVANGWKTLTDVPGVYYQSVPANTTANAKDYKVFQNFKLTGDANVAAYENAKINITAYAIQADGFATAADAWAAAPTEWKTTTTPEVTPEEG